MPRRPAAVPPRPRTYQRRRRGHPVSSADGPTPNPRRSGTRHQRAAGRGVPGDRRRTVRPRPCRPVPTPGGHDPLGPVHGRARQQDHPGPLRAVPRRGVARRGARRRGRGADPTDRLLPGEDPQHPRHGERGRQPVRRAGADPNGGPGDAARRRPQDGQRPAERRLRPARPARGHPRPAAVAATRPHRPRQTRSRWSTSSGRWFRRPSGASSVCASSCTGGRPARPGRPAAPACLLADICPSAGLGGTDRAT